jgi:hypothetical protein
VADDPQGQRDRGGTEVKSEKECPPLLGGSYQMLLSLDDQVPAEALGIPNPDESLHRDEAAMM